MRSSGKTHKEQWFPVGFIVTYLLVNHAVRLQELDALLAEAQRSSSALFAVFATVPEITPDAADPGSGEQP